jgi:hypothetical protein
VALANMNPRNTPRFTVNDLVWLSWSPDAGVVLKG